jgi:ribonuclease HI
MSEERLARIEAALADLATKADLANFATKDDLTNGIAGLATKAELATAISGLATKAELTDALAGVAKNVEIASLSRLVRQSITDTAAVRDEMRVMSATMRQLVGSVSGFAELLQALVDQQARTADRVRALEEQQP